MDNQEAWPLFLHVFLDNDTHSASISLQTNGYQYFEVANLQLLAEKHPISI